MPVETSKTKGVLAALIHSGGGHVDLSQLDNKGGARTGASTGGSGLGLDAEIAAAGEEGCM
jgi:hypothetical protein